MFVPQVARLASASVVCLLATLSGASAEDYRLGVQDRIRVTVHEWRASLGEVHDWKAITGEFTIGASGAISLPLIGSIPAAGHRPEELADIVSRRLQAKVGLAAPPDTAVEVVQFRPFYVVGRVERPGEFPYRPGLNVLQAISVAGGLHRLSDPALLRIDREAISAEGSVNALQAEADQLMMRRARLRAELENSDTIVFPPELSRRGADGATAELMKQEQLIMRARIDGLRTQTDALLELKNLLTKEVSSLGARLELKDRQLSLIRKELDNVGALVSKGLAVVPRQFSLERAEAEIENSRLELDTALLRARQEISRADRSIIEMRSNRRNEILVDLRQTEAKLEETLQRLDTARRLVAENKDFAAEFGAAGPRDQDPQAVFTIIRGTGSEAVETEVSETAPVRPGDLLKVIIKPPSQQRISQPRAPELRGAASLVQASPR
jgi:protein involved in polysaccharide export with SLBB domain